MARVAYEALKARLRRGWNTWNVRSVLSHVVLPQGDSVNLGVHDLKHTSDVFYHWGGLLGVPALMEAGILAGPEAPLDA